MDLCYSGSMPDKFTLTDDQTQVVNEIRYRLESFHGVDTSGLYDMAMIVRIAMIKDIMDSRNIELDQALSELGDRFLDRGALAGEMMAATKGTRHSGIAQGKTCRKL